MVQIQWLSARSLVWCPADVGALRFLFWGMGIVLVVPVPAAVSDSPLLHSATPAGGGGGCFTCLQLCTPQRRFIAPLPSCAH